jgi:hypothetical protein
MPSGQPSAPAPVHGSPQLPAISSAAQIGAAVPDGATGHGCGSSMTHGKLQKQPP